MSLKELSQKIIALKKVIDDLETEVAKFCHKEVASERTYTYSGNVYYIEPNDSKQRYENVLHEISLAKNDLNDLYAAVNELDDLIQNETGSNGNSEQ